MRMKVQLAVSLAQAACGIPTSSRFIGPARVTNDSFSCRCKEQQERAPGKEEPVTAEIGWQQSCEAGDVSSLGIRHAITGLAEAVRTNARITAE